MIYMKKENLNKYKFSTKTGFNSILLKLRYKELSSYYKGSSCLELGCADGEGTKMLVDYFDRVVAVDGSKKLINKAEKEILTNKVTFINSYFEDLNLKEKYDTIILAHILEHVDNPIDILKIAKKFIEKKGVIIVDVPNALSIHRQVGVLMGMIDSEYELNNADLSIGHKRVYDMKKLIKDVETAGLKVIKSGGIFHKPFSNDQLLEMLSKDGIIAFNEIGKRYPDTSAEIYIICSL